MACPAKLQPMSPPVIGAALFIISNPELVIAQCKNGVIDAIPALDARPEQALDDWLARIAFRLAGLDPDHLRLHDKFGRGPGAKRAVPMNI